MKLRAYLVDDEPPALERLGRLLRETERVELVGSTTSPELAVAEMNADPPDICFLDIHMPRLSGFEVLAQLPVQPAVVFTTAYDQYALKAFGVNSVDYLLKPVDAGALHRALNKLEQWQKSGQTVQPDLTLLLKQLTETLGKTAPEYLERIASRLADKLCFLDLVQVTHFFAEDKLTYAVSGGKAYCVDRSISDLEARLNPRKFHRIRRGTIVNLDWIQEISPIAGGVLNVRLKDLKGTNLLVARDRAREFKASIGC
jgi:two-component system LytT family response regulator